jgi:2-amino-4-hydroxy-6-hydroxymethyldihydropteridine diphosphokinase
MQRDPRPSRGVSYVVGVGSTGPAATVHIAAALHELATHPLLLLRATSRCHHNPATGGGTAFAFVNGAVVVETALAPTPLLFALRAIEVRVGRVRGRRYGARALDLDVLLAPAALSSSDTPRVPHPRLLLRPFAVVPAVEAMERAGLVVPPHVRAAAERLVGRHVLQEVRLPRGADPCMPA